MVDEIDEIEFSKAEERHAGEQDSRPSSFSAKSDKEFDEMLKQMENPVQAQKSIAVRIKMFLDTRMIQEMEEKGYLTDHTRRWVESYNSLLDKIQKALHGDKSMNVHVHKVSHSDISTKIRDANNITDVK